MPKNLWDLPYANTPRDRMVRSNVDVSADDKDLIMSVVPNHGFMVFMVQTLFSNVATYIRNNDLNFTDREQVIDFVRQYANPRVAQDANARDERSAAAGVCEHPANGAHVKSDVCQTPESGRPSRVQTRKSRKG